MATQTPLEDSVKDPAPRFEAASSMGTTSSVIASRLMAFSLTIAILYVGRAFFVTLISAIIITFILQPFVEFFMRRHMPRALASFLVCTIFVLLLYFAGLGLATQASGLLDDLPAYGKRMGEVVESAAERLNDFERSLTQTIMPKKLQETQPPVVEAPKKTRRTRVPQPEPTVPDPNQPPPVPEVRIADDGSPLLNFVYERWETLYNVILMMSFVPFLVYFMLSWSDHIQRSFLSLFDGAHRYAASKSLDGVAYMARAYMAGNFVLGVILALLSTLFFVMLKLPYPLLIGPLSGFLSLVPYVGLPMAFVPPFLAGLPVYTNPAAYLIIGAGVSILHLFALNLLYPKIVGARVHLNPLAVTIALMFWGLIWGGIGLVLAVPIVAGIKAVCDNVNSMRPYGRLLGD